jgi:hypothetical protein
LKLFSIKKILFAIELVSFSWTMAPVNWSLTLCQRLLWLFDEHQKSEDLSLEVLYLLLLLLLQCSAAVAVAAHSVRTGESLEGINQQQRHCADCNTITTAWIVLEKNHIFPEKKK